LPLASIPTPEQPAKPLTIARQEEEARMLVSDLLEIGMAQRKAYEEKQKNGTEKQKNGAEKQTNSAEKQTKRAEKQKNIQNVLISLVF
jgi:hypothetical protein